jgi:hypothetical protein
MAHFAKIEDGFVVDVVVVDDAYEANGEEYLKSIGAEGEWIQTSYNTRANVHYGADGKPDGGTPLRYNYAGVGFLYDRTLDAFISPKPKDENWIFNEDTCSWDLDATVNPISEQGDD